jgi:hypothetical protein
VEALWSILLITYAAGVVIGLFLIDEPLPARLGLAAVWPIGPLAFFIVVTVLLLVLPIAMPRAALVLAGIALLVWLVWRQ